MRSLRGGCVHEGKRVTEKRQRNRQRKTRVKDWRSRRDPSPSLPPPSLSRMDMGVFGSFPHAPRTNTKRFTQPDVTSWLLQHKRARTPTRAQTHTHTHTHMKQTTKKKPAAKVASHKARWCHQDSSDNKRHPQNKIPQKEKNDSNYKGLHRQLSTDTSETN